MNHALLTVETFISLCTSQTQVLSLFLTCRLFCNLCRLFPVCTRSTKLMQTSSLLQCPRFCSFLCYHDKLIVFIVVIPIVRSDCIDFCSLDHVLFCYFYHIVQPLWSQPSHFLSSRGEFTHHLCDPSKIMWIK